MTATIISIAVVLVVGIIFLVYRKVKEDRKPQTYEGRTMKYFGR